MPGFAWARLLPYVSAAVIIVGILLILAFAGDRRGIAFINSLPYFLLLALPSALLLWWTPRLSARQLQKHDPSVGGEFTHRTTANGLAVRTVAASIDLTWAHVVQVVETPEFFLYYFQRNAAYYTPKRAIPPGDLPSLRETIAASIGTKAHLSHTQGAA